MKKIVALLLCMLALNVQAQVKMRDVFAAMPDSLMPLMTRNNRLDCIDFIENNMEAKVRNRMDLFVELKTLTNDYLMLETSRASWVEMKLVNVDTTTVVVLSKTYKGPAVDSHVAVYTSDWKSVPFAVQNLLNVQRPDVASFFSTTTSDKGEDMEGVLLSLRDLTFLEAHLSDKTPTIRWSIGLEGLCKEQREVAQKRIQVVELPLVKTVQ